MPQQQAQQAIGAVVISSQLFEFAFVICAKIVLTQGEVTELSKIKPLSESKSFKQPTMSVLKELRRCVALDKDFEAKLEGIVERRHVLMHRWVHEPGWPDRPDDAAWIVVERFATSLAQDLTALTHVLLAVIVAWYEKYPESSAAPVKVDPSWLEKLPPEFRSMRIVRE